MTLYLVMPGSSEYSIGSRFFNHIRIYRGNGNFLEIEAVNNAPGNKYIQSATLNGKPMNKPFIHHDEIMKGGKLVFEMGDKANRNWGIENKVK